MQMDWFLTGLLPGYDGLFLFILLGMPAMVLIIIAWLIENKANKSSQEGATNTLVESYRAHSQGWNLFHHLALTLAFFLISQWFLFVFGFFPALIVFIVLVLYGKSSKSLEDVRTSSQSN